MQDNDELLTMYSKLNDPRDTTVNICLRIALVVHGAHTIYKNLDKMSYDSIESTVTNMYKLYILFDWTKVKK